MVFLSYSALLLSLIVQINGDTEIRCTEAFCASYVSEKGCRQIGNCWAMNATHHGVFLKYPDVCNCCDYCITYLGLGESCMVGFPGLQPESLSVCGPELSCTMNLNGSATCQRMKTPCIQEQDDYDKRRENGLLGMTEVRPKCNDDGTYAPQYCIPGSICFCLAPSGERIFGEIPFRDLWDEATMSCGCSLHAWKIQQTLDVELWKNEAALGSRCLENGLFDPLQCTLGNKGKCFCVDPVTGRPNKKSTNTVLVSNTTVGIPSCFDSARHTPGVYDTPCELLKYSKKTIPMAQVQIDEPNCQPDGMFYRLQTTKSSKICVDLLGNQMSYNGINYEANINSEAAKKMDCNCARTQLLLSQVGVIDELPKCCNNGNFESWQCRRNQCYCVDNNGVQTSVEVDSQDIIKLSCYQNGNGNPCLV